MNRLLTAASSLALAATPALAQDAEDVIVVDAIPTEDALSDTVSPITVLSGDELRRRIQNTIGDTIRLEPGVSSTSFGQGASRPIIRGQDGVRVRVLDSGIGSFDAGAESPDHAVALDPLIAEQIEVVRGAAQLLYGSSAVGGVVNVVNGRIPDQLPENMVEGAARAAFSSVDDGEEYGGAANIRLGKTGLVLHLDGSYREADDYEIPGFAESDELRAEEEAEEALAGGGEEEEEEEVFGKVENSFLERSSYGAGLSYIFDKGFIGFSASRFETQYGLPPSGKKKEEEEPVGGGAAEPEEEEEEKVSIDLEQTRYDLRGALRDVGPFELVRIRGAYADYEHVELEGSEVGTTFTNEGFEGRLEAVTPRNNGFRTIVGVQYLDREFEAIGDEAFVDPADTRQIGLFAFEDWQSGPWHLELGARYENTQVETNGDRFLELDPNADRSQDFNTFSVSGSAGYEIENFGTFILNAFRTERAPADIELFSNGAHLATNQFEVGNPALDVETALGLEASFRSVAGPATFSVNAFYTAYEDYIFPTLTGEEEDELPVVEFAAADVDFYGVEAQASLWLGDAGPFRVETDVLVEYVEGQLDEPVNGFEDLPRIPPFGGVAGIQATSSGLDLRLEAEWAGERSANSGQEFGTDAYAVLNAFITLRPFSSNVAIDIRGENLTDEEVRRHTSFLKDVAPQPGRNWIAAVRYDF